MWGVVKLEDECKLCFEAVGDQFAAIDYFRKTKFNRANSKVNMGHSWSDKDRKFPPKDFEISGD